MALGTPTIGVFAVEDTTAQVCWSRLPGQTATLKAADAEVVVTGPGPGAAVLEGLPADTELALEVRGARGSKVVERFRTLAPPPGPELCRIATVSDMHVGERAFGFFDFMVERRPDTPYAVRCLQAAVDEAAGWEPDTIVAKGDLTKHGLISEFESVGVALTSAGRPIRAIVGNHDTEEECADADAVLGPMGVDLTPTVSATDLPGIRLILVNSTTPPDRIGTLDHGRHEAIVDLAAAADRPVLVMVHHNLQLFDHVTHWPPGIKGGDADRLVQALARANPAVFVTSGHSHRNRAHCRSGVWVTEVGSTKDYPGVWAGYAVHEGGIRQVVRRIAEPSCIAWTDRTARAVGGVWGLWSPGSRSQRCFSVSWPRRAS